MRCLALVSVIILIFTRISVAAGEAVPGIECVGPECSGSKELSPQQKEGAALVKKYCTGCHTEARIMAKLKLMHQERDETFAADVKSIVLRMLRLSRGEISHQDGKKILEYLISL